MRGLAVLALAASMWTVGCTNHEHPAKARKRAPAPKWTLPAACAHLPSTPGTAAVVPTLERLRDAWNALRAPRRAHVGVSGAGPEARAEYRARLRRTIEALAPLSAGTPSAFERAWADPELRSSVANILPYLVLGEFPDLIRDGEHLGAREAVSTHRATVARIYCRALMSDDAAERLEVLRRRGGLYNLRRLDPLERLGLGAVVSAQLAAPDRETQDAALLRLCVFESPPRDDATVDRLRAIVYAPPERSYDNATWLRSRCGNWLLALIDTERSVRVLIDELFANPRNLHDARCAFARVAGPRHADAVRASYLRSEAGAGLPHATHRDWAARFLPRLELLDVVRADLRSSDGDRVNRGINAASRLPPEDAAPLLRAVLDRSDLPDPPNGERRPWGNHISLANHAREGLARAERRAREQPPTDYGCETWSCRIPTFGRPHPGCSG